MTIKELNLKVNDLQPYYFVAVVDAAGVGVNLTGATIVTTMESKTDGTLKIERESTGITLQNQTTNPGEFYYAWQAGETDTVSAYKIEFEVTPSSGGKFTVPAGSSLKEEAIVNINESLDTT